MMTNSYVHPVADGEITTVQDFAKRCSRAMMPLTHMRDEPMSAPIPRTIPLDLTHYEENLEEARAYLAVLGGEVAGQRAAYELAKLNSETSSQDYADKSYDELSRVKAMRDSLAQTFNIDWPDGLFDMMIKELDNAIEHNEPVGRYEPDPFPDFDRWLHDEWRRAQDAIGRVHADIEREKVLNTSRNAWLAKFWAAVDSLEAKKEAE